MIPPNPYDNLPPVGSTTEFFMTDGDWALLTADYLRRREVWLKHFPPRELTGAEWKQIMEDPYG